MSDLRDTIKEIGGIWQTWKDPARVRQVVRMCAGWTDIELLPIVRQMADSGRYKFFSPHELVRLARQKFGGGELEPDTRWEDMTAAQQRADVLRTHWSKMGAQSRKPHPNYRGMSDEQILALDAQQMRISAVSVYGKPVRYFNYGTGRHEA